MWISSNLRCVYKKPPLKTPKIWDSPTQDFVLDSIRRTYVAKSWRNCLNKKMKKWIERDFAYIYRYTTTSNKHTHTHTHTHTWNPTHTQTSTLWCTFTFFYFVLPPFTHCFVESSKSIFYSIKITFFYSVKSGTPGRPPCLLKKTGCNKNIK